MTLLEVEFLFPTAENTDVAHVCLLGKGTVLTTNSCVVKYFIEARRALSG